jgi:endonuclease/exonuclease/phosphatase family metal-dependent hydrolase
LRDLNGKRDTPERLVQAHRLAEVAAMIAAPGDPLVVCGDFKVLASLGLTDLVTTYGFKGTRTSHYKKPGRFADYMLVNDAVENARFTVVAEPEVSDHCPLILEI